MKGVGNFRGYTLKLQNPVLVILRMVSFFSPNSTPSQHVGTPSKWQPGQQGIHTYFCLNYMKKHWFFLYQILLDKIWVRVKNNRKKM